MVQNGMIRKSVRAQNCPVANAHRSFLTRSMIPNRYSSFCGYNVSGNARHMAAMNVIIPIRTMLVMRGDNSGSNGNAPVVGFSTVDDADWNSPLTRCCCCCCRSGCCGTASCCRCSCRLEDCNKFVDKYRSFTVFGWYPYCGSVCEFLRRQLRLVVHGWTGT